MSDHNPSSLTESPALQRKRRWLRWISASTAVVVLCVATIVALAPTILSGSIGRSIAIALLEDAVNGRVALLELQLSWSGPQVVRGLSITGSEGDSIAVDLEAKNGLVELATWSAAPDVRISGTVLTRYRPDGSLTIGDLFGSPRSSAASSAPAASASSGAARSATPSKSIGELIEGVKVEIASLRVVLTGAESGSPQFEASSIAGKLGVEGGSVAAKFGAKTRVDDREGSLEVDAQIGKWLDASGAVDLERSSVDITLTATEVAIPSVGVPVEVERISLQVKSARLAESARLDAEVTLRLPSGARSMLTAGLDAESPMDLGKIVARGRVGIEQFPTGVLASFVAAPIDLRRDLGETVDATLVVDGRSGSVTLKSAHCTAEASGSIAEGAKRLTVDSFALKATVDPALLAPNVVVDAPLAVEIKGALDGVALEDRTLRGMIGEARGKVEVSLAPAALRMEGKTVALGATTLVVASSRVADSATVALHSVVDGSPLALEATTSSPFETKGSARIVVALGDTNVETTLELTEQGYSSSPIHIESLVDPATAAKYAGEYVRVSAPTQVVVDLAPLAGSWQELSEGRGVPRKLSGSVAVADLVRAEWSLDMLDTLDMGEGNSGDLAAKADVAITDASALAAMLVTRAADAYLTGPGSINASFARRGMVDSFECDAKLPRVSASVRGRAIRPPAGGTTTDVVIELAQSSGSFDLPSIDPSLPVRDAKGAFSVESARWNGALGETALVGRLELERATADLGARGTAALTHMRVSIDTKRLQDGLKASVDGTIAMAGAPATPMSVTAALEGDFRGPLGESEVPLSIKSGRVSFKGSGDELLALAGTQDAGPGTTPLRLGALEFVCTTRGFTMPQVAGGTPSADLAIEFAPFTAELPGRPKLAFGKTTVSLKSPALDRELRVTLDGQLGIGSAAPAPIALSVEAVGDLSPLLGATDADLVVNQGSVTLKTPGELALAAIDFARSNKDASAALERLGAIDARLQVSALKVPKAGLAAASIDATLGVMALAVKVKDQPLIDLGATGVTIKSPALGRSIDATLATGSPKAGSIEITAHGEGQVNATGAFAAAAGAWTATARASRVQTALVDSVLGEGGRLAEALGPTLDLSLHATPAQLPGGTAGTHVAATLKTSTLDLSIPRAVIGSGALSISADAPLALTFTINDALKGRLLEPINPVLADIRSAPPIKVQVTRLSYPLDGNLSKLDADARIEVGDVQVVRSNQVLGVLALAQESKETTIPARIDPLAIMVRHGRLTYSDFVVKAGKFGDLWQHVLKLSGDIDLTKTPPYANAITCRYPLSSLGRTMGAASGPFSTTAQALSAQIRNLPIDPGDLVQVDVTLSGPLGEVDGQASALESQVKLTFDPSAIDAKQVEKGIKDLGKTVNDFKKLFGG